ncbi:MAG TPA: LptF/LptG family permease [Chlorobiota bacterium]|nr:LptF/LptG family permease [Chlorobiota bacterium]
MLIWRYIFRAHIAPFIFGTATIMALFLMQVLINWIDKLAGKGLDIFTIVEFIVLSLSWIVVLAVPIGVLFSTLMAYGGLSSTHETTIFKASGMGLFTMMVPSVIGGLALWAFVFWYTDNVLPDSNLRLSTMMRDINRTKPTFAVEAGQFTTQIEGYTILARDMDTAGTMYGVTIYDNSRADQQNIVNADTGKLGFSPSSTRLIVQLSSGEIHQVNRRRPMDYRTITFARHQIAMPSDRFFYEQSDPTGSSRGEREMRISDMQEIVDRSSAIVAVSDRVTDSLLRGHIAWLSGKGANGATDTQTALLRAQSTVISIRSQLESESFRRSGEVNTIRRYEVEIYKKYAIPFACILFIVVGCPMGILTKGGNFGISAAISLGFYVVYWASLIGGEKLADRGLLSPAFSMWLGNIILGIVGILVSIRVNYEISVFGLLKSAFRRSTAASA